MKGLPRNKRTFLPRELVDDSFKMNQHAIGVFLILYCVCVAVIRFTCIHIMLEISIRVKCFFRLYWCECYCTPEVKNLSYLFMSSKGHQWNLVFVLKCQEHLESRVWARAELGTFLAVVFMLQEIEAIR